MVASKQSKRSTKKIISSHSSYPLEEIDQNPPTSSDVPPPEQILSNPSRNGDLSDIESGNPMSGNTQQVVPHFAGNPSQFVPREAPKTGCNGPCCIPLQTACLVIGAVGVFFGIFEVINFKFVSLYTPPPFVIAIGIGSNYETIEPLFYGLSVPILIFNGLLIVGSMMKNSVFVIIYLIVAGVYVLTFIISLSKPFIEAEVIHYFFILLWIYFLVVAGFYFKELKTGQTQRQGQVYMPQGQGQVYMQQGQGQFLETLGQNQISRSPSQANGQSGQVIGSPEQGQAVRSPGQGQQYGQSY